MMQPRGEGRKCGGGRANLARFVRPGVPVWPFLAGRLLPPVEAPREAGGRGRGGGPFGPPPGLGGPSLGPFSPRLVGPTIASTKRVNPGHPEALRPFRGLEVLVHVGRGERLLRRGDWAGAKREVEGALARSPNDPRALQALDEILQELERESQPAPLPLGGLLGEDAGPQMKTANPRGETEVLEVRVTPDLPALIRADLLRVADGGVTLRPARKRFHGAPMETPFAAGRAWVAEVAGAGRVLLSKPGLRFRILEVDGAPLYALEHRMMALTGELEWENGRVWVPGGPGPALSLVRLKGVGAVALAARGPLHRIDAGDRGSIEVDVRSLVAWTGSLVPEVKILAPPAGPARSGRLFVELRGEGSAYLEVYP